MKTIIGKYGYIKELANGTFLVKLAVKEDVVAFEKKDLTKYLKAIEPTHTDKGNIVIHSGWFGNDDSE